VGAWWDHCCASSHRCVADDCSAWYDRARRQCREAVLWSVRAPGGGRKKAEVADPELVEVLDGLIEPETRGDPESPLRWTTRSTRHLAGELSGMGHCVGHDVVAKILHSLRYSLQGTRKKLEGSRHPDRDDQFRYINKLAKEFLAAGDPVISVDTKKKELVGRFAQAGEEWHPQGEPVDVSTYDFPSEADGKAIPYGVYDVTDNSAWVCSGNRPRHLGIRCRYYPEVVGNRGQGEISRRPPDLHHRRRWRIQWTPPLALETRTRTTRRRDRTGNHRVPLPARHQQME
jgi:hypothetical protein